MNSGSWHDLNIETCQDKLYIAPTISKRGEHLSFLALLFLMLFVYLFPVVLMFAFREPKRKTRQVPILRGVYDEGRAGHVGSRGDGDQRGLADESTRLESLIRQLREIDEKIRLVRAQNVSEEAKRIIIQELEDERKNIEEEIRKHTKTRST